MTIPGLNFLATCEIFSRRTQGAIAFQKKLMQKWIFAQSSYIFKNPAYQINPSWFAILENQFFDAQLDFVHRRFALCIWQTCKAKQEKVEAPFDQLLLTTFNNPNRLVEQHNQRQTLPLVSTIGFLRYVLPYVNLQTHIYKDITRLCVRVVTTQLAVSADAADLLLQLPLPDNLDNFCKQLVNSISNTESSEILNARCQLLNHIMALHADKIPFIQTLLSTYFSGEDRYFRLDVLMGLKTCYIKHQWMTTLRRIFFQLSPTAIPARLTNLYFVLEKHSRLLPEYIHHYLHEVVLKKLDKSPDEAFRLLDLPEDCNSRKIQIILNKITRILLRKINTFFNLDNTQQIDHQIFRSSFYKLTLIVQKLQAVGLKKLALSTLLNAFNRYSPELDYRLIIIFIRNITSNMLSIFFLLNDHQKSSFKHAIERKLLAPNPVRLGIVQALLNHCNVKVARQLGVLDIDPNTLVQDGAGTNDYLSQFVLWHRLQKALEEHSVEDYDKFILQCATPALPESCASVVYFAIEYAQLLYLKYDKKFTDICLRVLIQVVGSHEAVLRTKALDFFTMLSPSLSDQQRTLLLSEDLHSFEFSLLKDIMAQPRHLMIEKTKHWPEGLSVSSKQPCSS